MEPQFFPCAAHVVGVQPHTFGVPPPPHVCGDVHVPQLSVPPQPLLTDPQFLPISAQLFGTQMVVVVGAAVVVVGAAVVVVGTVVVVGAAVVVVVAGAVHVQHSPQVLWDVPLQE